MIAHIAEQQVESNFASDVRTGLGGPGQKQLPSRYLYDELGTALFEAITLLPEYGLTRADERLLQAHAGEIVDRLPSGLAVVELGSGTGRKTRWVLDALRQRQPVDYYPIDISASALLKCKQEFDSLPGVRVRGLERSYLDGLQEAARQRAGRRLLVLFLGSTIGNFDRHEAEDFISEIRATLAPGDALLLGADLEKAMDDMLLAYDDPTGITAAFNLNVLARMNRELDADFDLRCFTHEARYDRDERRIEMHLRSRWRQSVSIRGALLNLTLAEGETIWTESSHKFRASEIRTMAERTGFGCAAQWVDREWPFAETLLVAK